MTAPIAALLFLVATASQPTPVFTVQDAYPDVSPDGAHLAFQSNRSGNVEIWTARIDGSEPKQLTRTPAEEGTPVFSPDGKTIVYGSGEDLWLMDADGGNQRKLVRAPNNHAAWSPDGKRIAFSSTMGDDETHDLYDVDIETRKVRRLTDNAPIWDSFPSYTREGKRLVFRRLLVAEVAGTRLVNSEVMIMDADGGAATNLTNDPSFDGWPVVSPDGRRIAFASNREDMFQVYVMDLDGANLVRVTESPYTDVRPTWTPDGTRILFNRDRDGAVQILAVPAPPASAM